MFSAILAEHAQKQAAVREENERARRAVAASLASVTEDLASAVNDGELCGRAAPLQPLSVAQALRMCSTHNAS